MSIFSASSRSNRSVLPDGSQAVICSSCGDPICHTTLKMSTAVCAVCAKAESGEYVPPEVITQYDAGKGKLHFRDLSSVAVRAEAQAEDKVQTNRSRRLLKTMGSGILKAFGIEKEATLPVPSVKVAQEKRLGSLFGDEKELK